MPNPRIWQLVARKLSKEATMEELRELEQLLQSDPELGYRIGIYAGYFDQSLESMRSEEEKKRSWEKCRESLSLEFPEMLNTDHAIPRRSFFRRPIIRYTALAASLLLAVTTTIFWYYHSEKRSPQLVQTLPLHEVNTMPGTRSKMVLPDGTVVWLNSESRLYYNADFGKTKREVTLLGEAFFDVVKNEQVPMVVHAGTVNIWVKGTAFNVKNYPETENVEASLIRGSIELSTNADPGRRILLKPNEKITIKTSAEIKRNDTPRTAVPAKVEQGYYKIDILHESALSRSIPEVAWIDNKLVFDNESFSDVIIKMEKWYNVEIILKNEQLAAKQFSGAFEKEDISEALSALQIINPFDFEIKGKKVFIK